MPIKYKRKSRSPARKLLRRKRTRRAPSRRKYYRKRKVLRKRVTRKVRRYRGATQFQRKSFRNREALDIKTSNETDTTYTFIPFSRSLGLAVDRNWKLMRPQRLTIKFNKLAFGQLVEQPHVASVNMYDPTGTSGVTTEQINLNRLGVLLRDYKVYFVQPNNNTSSFEEFFSIMMDGKLINEEFGEQSSAKDTFNVSSLRRVCKVVASWNPFKTSKTISVLPMCRKQNMMEYFDRHGAEELDNTVTSNFDPTTPVHQSVDNGYWVRDTRWIPTNRVNSLRAYNDGSPSKQLAHFYGCLVVPVMRSGAANHSMNIVHNIKMVYDTWNYYDFRSWIGNEVIDEDFDQDIQVRGLQHEEEKPGMNENPDSKTHQHID